MADQRRRPRSGKGSHIVLIPGFTGFDALGQLEYYSGIVSPSVTRITPINERRPELLPRIPI